MNQHTGNWAGKTVDIAQGEFTHKNRAFSVIDLPGTYSLMPASPDEKVAKDYISCGKSDIILIVADATCLERNLNLVLQIKEFATNIILCLNLMDEAHKKGINIDLKKLSDELSISVIPVSARSGKGIPHLRNALFDFAANSGAANSPAFSPCELTEKLANQILKRSKLIFSNCVVQQESAHSFDRKLDSIVTSKLFGFPIMLAMLGIIFWLTIVGANYPSQLLSTLFDNIGSTISKHLYSTSIPTIFVSAFMDGIYKTLTWVIAVMLPPMTIFFPLFALLEDFGYLPRVAFNMDKSFKKSCAHGRQALTMCQGFGCNACGVMGCRIIDSERERLIAIITNNFMPCNGRFPTLIAIISMFFVGSKLSGFSSIISSLVLTALIALGVIITLLTSKLLSKTLLQGKPSSFSLELPPYRVPKFKQVLVRSIVDRAVFVLGRAILVAAPAGLLIWLFANMQIHGETILHYCTAFLEPLGCILGVDGVILIAFVLGFPANEIVLPIIIMTYLAQGSLIEFSTLDSLRSLLIDNGWTMKTALCTMLLCVFHFPCGTTCLTIQKEAGSFKWTLASILIPTGIGFFLCFLVNLFTF